MEILTKVTSQILWPCVLALLLCTSGAKSRDIPGWRPSTVGYMVEAPDSFTQVGNTSMYGSTLSTVDLSSGPYQSGPVYILNLTGTGTRYQQGWDAGFLTGGMAVANYDALVNSLLSEKFLHNLTANTLGHLVDWQWNKFLSKQVPAAYMEEIAGLQDGGAAAGVKDVGLLAARVIVLANMPGDVGDFKYILQDEWHKRPATLQAYMTPSELLGELPSLKLKPELGHCSMIGVWGSLTTPKGSVFTGRNLDWNANTGIDKYKLVTIFNYAPSSSGPSPFSHATVGYAGVWGALTGISSQGVSVHEANLEEHPISFRGFPWLLRLRYLMEQAQTVKDAEDIWGATNNTVGFNHGVGSPVDGFVVFETRAGYTATFRDDDPREANATGPFVGAPLKNALWRTNHGFDPSIQQGYTWNPPKSAAGVDSDRRYHIIANSIREATQITGEHSKLMDIQSAVNVTAVVGHKNNNFLQCQPPYKDGSNVISATYDLVERTLYAAWEDGSSTTWKPAACNTYIQLDLKKFFV